tara:strand:+ start:1108 stop:1263 length:156 start_codon:yes stop_codon:yes gene_type:complete
MGLSVYISKKFNLKSKVAESIIRRGLVTVNGRVITATRYPTFPDDIVVVSE